MKPIFLIITGKAYSGKDTLADSLAEIISGLPGPEPRKLARRTFSDAICVEADQGIAAARTGLDAGASVKEIVQLISVAADLSTSEAAVFWESIVDDLLIHGKDLRAADRTHGIRNILQLLGREWRPEDYWARRVVADCEHLRANGFDVVTAGFRYPAEYGRGKTAGAYSVRLDISREAQDARALARDGHVMTEQARAHTGETVLDSFTDFDLRVNTDNLDRDAVLAVVAPAVLAQLGYATTFTVAPVPSAG